MGSTASLADGYASSYQATETMPRVPLPDPSRAPYHSHLLAYPLQYPFQGVTAQSPLIPSSSSSSFVELHNHSTISPSCQEFLLFGWFIGNVVALSPFSPPTVSNGIGTSVEPQASSSNTICICQWSPTCEAVLDGNNQALRSHLKQEHQFDGSAKDLISCLWAGCDQSLRRENVPRHIITRHLRVKVSCPPCGMALSRRDVQYTRAKVCWLRAHPFASRLPTDVSSTNPIPPSSNPMDMLHSISQRPQAGPHTRCRFGALLT